MDSHPLSLTPPKMLFALACLWHAAWASTVLVPSDWDPAYALEVARHLARGEGAVTDAVWNLGWLPDTLRHPADLHWMPLPSRVLVPFVALAPPGREWFAAQLATVLIAAGWAPLGWAWARRLGATDAESWCAGLLAGCAGGYVRTITTPDSIALYGLLGGAALLAASQRHPLTTFLVAGAALTRGDGFLLGAACVLAWPGLRGWAVGAAGLGATALWSLRCWLVAGEGWVALRMRAANSLTLGEILRVEQPDPPDLSARLAFLGGELRTIGAVALVVTVGLLAWPALVEGYKRRGDRGLWPIGAYLLGFPVVIHLLAPAIAAEGSVYRSGSAAFAAVCALAAVGVSRLTRRYHPAFLPGLLVAATIGGSVVIGRTYMRVLTQLGGDCAALDAAGAPAGAAVASYDPIGVAARCERPGIILARGADPSALADRYGIGWALVAPEDYDNGTMRAVDWTASGWERVSERVWRRGRIAALR